MSDGPHRSLPMQQHWRGVAEQAYRPAFSVTQVSESLTYAQMRELADAPIAKVREAVCRESLFKYDVGSVVAEVEATREYCRGSSSGNSLIDNIVVALMEGLSGEDACRKAIEGTIEDQTRSACRSIEEHYLRKAGGENAAFIRGRMEEAQQECKLAEVAERLLQGDRPSSIRPVKQTGTDEGPPL